MPDLPSFATITPTPQISPFADAPQLAQFLSEGVALSPAAFLNTTTWENIRAIAFQLAEDNLPIPAPVLLADLASLILTGNDATTPPQRIHKHYWDYTDKAFTRLQGDVFLPRIQDALRLRNTEQKRKAVGYLGYALSQRLDLPFFHCPPALLRNLQNWLPEQIQASFPQSFPLETISDWYSQAIPQICRRFSETVELFDEENLKEIELGTLFLPGAQRLALRQIQKGVRWLNDKRPESLPPIARRRIVPTRLKDDDLYPVGGYSSIATRGSLESLLHSQLAYVEDDPQHQPDLFTLKFLRDELFYYSRDDNDFQRSRRRVLIYFSPNLLSQRWKDPDLPMQRLTLTLSYALAMLEWAEINLGHEGQQWLFCFGQEEGKTGTFTEEIEQMLFCTRLARERGIANCQALSWPGFLQLWEESLHNQRTDVFLFQHKGEKEEQPGESFSIQIEEGKVLFDSDEETNWTRPESWKQAYWHSLRWLLRN